MGWRDFVGKAFTREAFTQYVNGLVWQYWRPKGVVIHNTAAPTLAQWAEEGPRHEARIRNLRHYYEFTNHWPGGPHLFVSRRWITVFDGLLEPGVHSPSFNREYLGIEMVGDFSREPFNSGDGALVRDNAVYATAVLLRRLRLPVNDRTIRFHKEDPRTTHDCPGKLVNKSDFVARVRGVQL